MLENVLTWAHSHPLHAIAALMVAAIAVAAATRGGTPETPRDGKRAFTAAERTEIFRRAGGRCEHKGMFLRCKNTNLHADHIQPWSKGGQTNISNAQALCAFHNLSKGGKIPTARYIKRLQRGRKKYYPR